MLPLSFPIWRSFSLIEVKAEHLSYVILPCLLFYLLPLCPNLGACLHLLNFLAQVLFVWNTHILLFCGMDFLLCASWFFGCSNNQINIGQINRRKANLIVYVWGPQQNMRPIGNQAVRLICHSELRRRGWGSGTTKWREAIYRLPCRDNGTQRGVFDR